MAAPSKSFTVVADGDIDLDSPITEALYEDFRDNDIHLSEWMGTSANADAPHRHLGLLIDGTDIISSPMTRSVAFAKWDGDGSGSNRIIETPPLEFDIAITNVIPHTSENSGFLIVKSHDGTDDTEHIDWANGTRSTNVLAGSHEFISNGLFLNGSSNMNLSSQFYTAILLREAAGILAIGTYQGNADTGGTRAIDISTTSHSSQADFQPEGVFVFRTDSGIGTDLKTEDHSGLNSSDIAAGTLNSDRITSFESTGFSVDDDGALNTNNAHYKYMAWKAGSANGLTIEKLTPPTDGVAAYLDQVNVPGYAFMAFAIQTSGSPTRGMGFRTFLSSDLINSMLLDTTTESTEDGITGMADGRLRLGAQFPNNSTAETQNIWVFGTGGPMLSVGRL